MNMIKFAELISFLTNVTGNRFNADTISDIERRIGSFNEPSQSPALVEVIKVDLVPLFDWIAKGLKIDAIREYRALTGMSLKESKDEIERIMKVPA